MALRGLGGGEASRLDPIAYRDADEPPMAAVLCAFEGDVSICAGALLDALAARAAPMSPLAPGGSVLELCLILGKSAMLSDPYTRPYDGASVDIVNDVLKDAI